MASGDSGLRKTMVLLAMGVAVMASGCRKGVEGSYRCIGMPDISTLSLESDGSYTSNGNILGHATPGSGKYIVNGGQVTLEGSYRVEGLTQIETNMVVFDRQKNGDLKSLLTTCKK
jgi:hypothetical protein